MDVLIVDLGLATVLLGTLALLRPLAPLRIPTRRRAAQVLVLGLVLLATGLAWPVSPPRLGGSRMLLDEVLPAYQFGERHEIRIAAPRARVFAAVRLVTAGEIRFFRLLTWLRAPRLPGPGRESILNAPADRPILDVALGSGFLRLREEADREIVVGAIVCCGPRPLIPTADDFQATSGSLAQAVMNFHLEDDGPGATRLVTETRIHATDARAERRFAVYWRLIYPGSAFIRRMWLEAIRNKAESPPAEVS
jgi:hypothetical protein